MQNKTFRQLLLIINFTFAKIKIAKSGFFTYSQNINNANISQYTVIEFHAHINLVPYLRQTDDSDETITTVTAVSDYKGQYEDELSFKQNDKIQVINEGMSTEKNG